MFDDSHTFVCEYYFNFLAQLLDLSLILYNFALSEHNFDSQSCDFLSVFLINLPIQLQSIIIHHSLYFAQNLKIFPHNIFLIFSPIPPSIVYYSLLILFKKAMFTHPYFHPFFIHILIHSQPMELWRLFDENAKDFSDFQDFYTFSICVCLLLGLHQLYSELGQLIFCYFFLQFELHIIFPLFKISLFCNKLLFHTFNTSSNLLILKLEIKHLKYDSRLIFILSSILLDHLFIILLLGKPLLYIHLSRTMVFIQHTNSIINFSQFLFVLLECMLAVAHSFSDLLMFFQLGIIIFTLNLAQLLRIMYLSLQSFNGLMQSSHPILQHSRWPCQTFNMLMRSSSISFYLSTVQLE